MLKRGTINKTLEGTTMTILKCEAIVFAQHFAYFSTTGSCIA